MTPKEKLTQSLEKYLLAIYEIVQLNKGARVKDVSNYLKIGGPSASDAVKTLANKKFINYEPYGIITLTRKGKKQAEEKIKRHKVIKDFFENVLMIDELNADKNAQIMEYSMTEDVINRFICFLEFMKNCSCKEPKWIKSCKINLLEGKISDNCEKCISQNKGGCSNCCKSF